MSKFISVLGLFFAVNAHAGNLTSQVNQIFPVLQCPAVTEEFATMISKLETIKTSIKATANCQNVVLQVDSLQKLLDDDRQKVLDIVSSSQEQGLTAEQSKIVKDYAEGLTKKVASLNDLFLNSNQCFSEDANKNQLASLAGFVGEASQLVGSVSGPWGAPIALAGNVVAGFLTGLDAVLKSRAGYDFDNRAQWLSYVQNLCTYHSYREQIAHLIDPAGRIHELKVLKGKLEAQISAMTNSCEECRTIASNFNSQSTLLNVQSMRELVDKEVRAADAKFSKPYGSYTLQNLGLRDWVTGEIKRMEKEAAGEWGNASGQYILTRAKDEIEDFLIRREAPKFLDFQVARGLSDYYAFRGFVADEGQGLYNSILQTNTGALTATVPRGWGTDPISYFNALILNPIHWDKLIQTEAGQDLQFSWNHFRAQSLLALRTSQTTTRVAQSFCSFFKHTDQYNSDIRSACANPQFKDLVAQQTQLDQEIGKAKAWSPSLTTLEAEPIVADDANLAMDAVEALTKTIELRGVGL